MSSTSTGKGTGGGVDTMEVVDDSCEQVMVRGTAAEEPSLQRLFRICHYISSIMFSKMIVRCRI